MVKRICRCRTPTRDGSLRQEEAVGVRVEVCNASTGAELRNVVPWQGIAWSGGRGAGEGVQWELCVGIAVGEGRKKQVMRKRLPWRGGKACAATWCSGWRGSLAVCMGRRGEGGVRVQHGAQGTNRDIHGRVPANQRKMQTRTILFCSKLICNKKTNSRFWRRTGNPTRTIRASWDTSLSVYYRRHPTKRTFFQIKEMYERGRGTRCWYSRRSHVLHPPIPPPGWPVARPTRRRT